MVLSGILLKLPYTLVWHIVRLFRRNPRIVFHCAEVMDWNCFAPIVPHLPETRIVSPRGNVRNYLREIGIVAHRMPAFPRAVIMCRHATHKYPCASIVKIGLRHGPYHFKRMTSAANYNQFDLYLFSSPADLAAAQAIGVTVGAPAGFPRLDPALDGTISPARLDELRESLQLDPAKPTLLFTATWDASGMSAVGKWYDRLELLAAQYNILVTVHPWTDAGIIARLRGTPAIHYLENQDLLPFIMLADICIGDQSSLLAECSALDKPIISFHTPSARRSLPEIEALMQLISLRIMEIDELQPAIQKLLADPLVLSEGRRQANAVMFDALDGKAAQRAAAMINKLLQERNI